MWNGKIEDIILFKDKDILVCRKPAGIAVQNAGIGTRDMESMLKNYLAGETPGKLPYLGIVHRLDQPVEGVMVFALNKKAAGELSRRITAGQWHKEYLAVTDTVPGAKKGTLIDYLKKDGRTNLSSVVPKGTAGAKEARLSYEILERIPDPRTGSKERVLVKVLLDTGRHHQIRVQMAHAGMPLLGDRKYYPEDISGLSLGLCSYRLCFTHPIIDTKEEFCLRPEGSAFAGFSAL